SDEEPKDSKNSLESKPYQCTASCPPLGINCFSSFSHTFSSWLSVCHLSAPAYCLRYHSACDLSPAFCFSLLTLHSCAFLCDRHCHLSPVAVVRAQSQIRSSEFC